mgnify:CR=1 FL=1
MLKFHSHTFNKSPRQAASVARLLCRWMHRSRPAHTAGKASFLRVQRALARQIPPGNRPLQPRVLVATVLSRASVHRCPMNSEGLHCSSIERTAVKVRLWPFQRTLALQIVLGDQPGAGGCITCKHAQSSPIAAAVRKSRKSAQLSQSRHRREALDAPFPAPRSARNMVRVVLHRDDAISRQRYIVQCFRALFSAVPRARKCCATHCIGSIP